MTRTSEITAELQLAQDLMMDYAQALTGQGFSYAGTEVHASKVTTDFATFTFRNENTGIGITLSYFPWSGSYRGFFATITNSKENKLDVNEYLRLHRQTDTLQRFVTHDKMLDTRQFWERFFHTLTNLLATDLRNIANGKEWEAIPFNWDGYR